ncbi:hypothetical protein ACNQKP_01095 [Bdellovibrio bacteriovorus]|uniref:hypothetical protein n=1 Tax=Bdellovibrio bacteriovorus TaxID=959 RepID=UPI003AA89360
MESKIRTWANTGISVPMGVVVVAALISSFAPERVSHYGWSLVMVAISFQFLATKNVGAAVGGINKFLRLCLAGLWIAGFVLNISIRK